MKYVAIALVLAAFTINVAGATGPQEKPFDQTMVKCCVKSLALDTPPRCFQTTAQDCFKQGGKEVKDCAQCK